MPKRGTRPGDPGADILFAFLEAKVTRTYLGRLEELGLLCEVPSPGIDQIRRGELGPADGKVPINDALYADDDALPVVAPASAIIDKTGSAAGVVIFTLQSFGLEVNLGDGKTEAVFSFAGAGKAAAARDLWVGRGG